MARRTTYRTPIQATLGPRLFFVWAIIWGAIATPPLALGLLVHNLLVPGLKTFNFWLTLWARAVLLGLGVRLKSDIRAVLTEEQPIVLVANHQNMLDIVTCAAGIPHKYAYTPKEELKKMPVIGAVLRSTDNIFIDRRSARRAAESIREAGRSVRGGISVLVYAEGERTFSPDTTRLLRGAFILAVEAGVPLVPVVQLNNYTVLDERRRLARPGTVHLLVADPIPTIDATAEDIPALMQTTRSVMEVEIARFHGASPGTDSERAVSSGASEIPSSR